MKDIIIKLLNLPKLIRFLAQPKDLTKRWDPENDLDLELYSKIFSNQALHYGFFEKKKPAKSLSFADIEKAMSLYTQFILKKISRYGYVLDVGCGNGVILEKMHQKKKKALGITPNQKQISHIKRQLPHLKVIKSTFENINIDEIPEINKLDLILMAESFQYLSLEETFKKISDILSKKPKNKGLDKGLTWIIFDYFRINKKSQNESGHDYFLFKKTLKNFRFAIEEEEDFTEKILPTLGYVHFLATTFTRPLVTHFKKNLAHTNPLISYLFYETLEEQINKINFNVVDPQFFKKEKKYLFLKIKPKLV